MRCLTLIVLLVLAGSLCFASPAPASDSSPGLSQEEGSAIYSALEQSNQALERSSKEIAAQSRRIRTLSIFFGVTATALSIDLAERAIEALVRVIKK